jgi:tripeptide aminopeptidase
MKKDLIDRFVRYAKIDTQSDPNSTTIPTTLKQFDLSKLLVQELQEMGYKDAFVNDKCYVYATIPSNVDKSVPSIGFVAHVDTAPDTTGTNCQPQVIDNYQGGDIKLGNSDVVITMAENPMLEKCIGHTLIHTDGTTLLGSDDKSGVASIMQFAKYCADNPDYKHGTIKICFTPDEEVGRGADHFDIQTFNCEYAYTIDGSLPIGELNKETFSADMAIITVNGRDIHPGSAKDIMLNSIRPLSSIITKLPMEMSPEMTEGNEPFIHPHHSSSTVSKSELVLILRDFNTEGLELQKEILEDIIEEVKQEFPLFTFNLEVKKQYRNMLDVLTDNPRGCDFLFEAAERAGTNPYWSPIRGGTDGSRLTEMGLPTPNIFTGGQNFHSVTEWMSVDALLKTIETMQNLVTVWYEKA